MGNVGNRVHKLLPLVGVRVEFSTPTLRSLFDALHRGTVVFEVDDATYDDARGVYMLTLDPAAPDPPTDATD